MKVKELMDKLSTFDPEMEVFLVSFMNNDEVSYEGYVLNKSSSIHEQFVVSAPYITDGGHVFEEEEYIDYMQDQSEDDSDFSGKAVVINGY